MELPEAGHVFQGRYKLVDLLGRGGFAAVYRAIDVEIGREVAIKVLLPGADGYASGLVARFLREARVVAQLRDPHTITMFDFGRTDDGLLYMVFEYVAGADLAHVLSERGPLPPDTVVHVLDQILRALREAHAAGVLHRDIKPANILVYTYMDDPWQVKLLDFGIAKPGVGKNADPVATITQAGGVVGTPRYMAPEQLWGGELTPATDLYSLGLVAYELLVGRPAIDGGTTRENLKLQLSESPILLPPGSALPPVLRGLIERMVAKDPAARPQSAYEVLTALAELHGVPVTAEPGRTPSAGLSAPPASRATARHARVEHPPAVAPPPPPMRHGLSLPAIAALGALAGVALVVPLVAFLSRDASPPADPAVPPAHPTVVRANPLGIGSSAHTPPSEPAVAAVAADDEGDDGPCSGHPPRAGRSTQKATVALADRSWEVYTPAAYTDKEPVPLLLLFHDRTRSGLRELQEMGFVPFADEEGFVIVALNDGSYMTPWRDPADPKYVEQVIEHVSDTHCIDRTRIYAVGHNIAGKLVESLPCEVPLAGIATTAHRTVPTCVADPPVPFLHISGKLDQYHPQAGGVGCDGLADNISMQEKQASWREANRCSGASRVHLAHANGECRTWDCEAPAVFCLVDGGRDWPNSSPRDLELPACKVPPADFPYAETIWAFFKKQRRTAARGVSP